MILDHEVIEDAQRIAVVLLHCYYLGRAELAPFLGESKHLLPIDKEGMAEDVVDAMAAAVSTGHAEVHCWLEPVGVGDQDLLWGELRAVGDRIDVSTYRSLIVRSFFERGDGSLNIYAM